jgi:hypothetical protein
MAAVQPEPWLWALITTTTTIVNTNIGKHVLVQPTGRQNTHFSGISP